MKTRLITLAALAALALPGVVFAGFEEDLASIQTDWAEANYEIQDKKAALAAFESLAQRAHSFAQANPDRAEPLVWEGIVLSSWAGKKGGLGALKLCKEARASLEAAEALDPAVLQGSVYTSLGTLYYRVPGWPVGFGDDDKAETYLRKALDLNPEGIDPNYFYGDFLAEQGEYDKARVYLEKAMAAPARPGRETADAGRREEIRQRLAEVATHS
jgi:tetratricopeptide (TPR) repeat protein